MDVLGIRVDIVKQDQGTTNDARSFFRNYELSSQIIGIDKNLFIVL